MSYECAKSVGDCDTFPFREGLHHFNKTYWPAKLQDMLQTVKEQYGLIYDKSEERGYAGDMEYAIFTTHIGQQNFRILSKKLKSKDGMIY